MMILIFFRIMVNWYPTLLSQTMCGQPVTVPPFFFFLTELWSEKANGSSLGKGKVSQKEQLYAVGSFVYC